MKPRTRLQQEVWKLHLGLNEPVEHEQYISLKHDHYYAPHYKNLVCLECNHMWKPDMAFWKEELLGIKCPSCSKKLKKVNYESRSTYRVITYSVVQVVERFQVVRYFSCWKHLSKTEAPKYHYRNLFEEWTDYEKNKKVIVGLNTTWTGDGFSSSTYEIRANKQPYFKSSTYDSFNSDFNTPGAQFLPRFDKFGLGEDFHNCDYRMLLRMLEHSSVIETLFKAKQKELLFYAVHKDGGGKHHRFWPQIKIALRQKFKIMDAGIWYDYLEMLSEFGKDLRNPKFICPPDLKRQHDRWMVKKAKIEEARRRERELEQIAKEQKNLEKAIQEYAIVKAKLFHLKFVERDLTIEPLRTIDEFKQEGVELKHCVYTNAYYKKKDSLVLSARIKGKRTETIEIILSKMTISQSRGFGNSATKYHDRILELVKKNFSKIQAAMKEKKITNQDQQHEQAA